MQFRLYFGRLRAAQWNRMGAAEIMGRRPEGVGPWPIGAQEGIGRWPSGRWAGSRWREADGRAAEWAERPMRGERGPMADWAEEGRPRPTWRRGPADGSGV